LIATTSLQNVTGYRFRVTNTSDGAAPNQVQIIERGGMHWFSLSMLTTYQYGTTYLVEVSIKTANGQFSEFGSPCAVTAPAVPTLTNCGAVIPTKTAVVKTTSLDRVTSYRFQLTNLSATPNTVTTIDRPTNYFTFNNVPGFVPGATYGVQVAVMTSGVYSLYGDGCEITAPASAREKQTPFNAVAYPNPFADGFAINVTTTTDELVGVKVYDMTGRLLESRNHDLGQMETLQIGQRYPSGVYNVIVTQGTEVKTLRVIKR
jgi:hypothetical protein